VSGTIIYAGVDYGAIIKQAEKEADIILWDGGNNDMPFYKPDMHIVVTDPLRTGHELSYYPSEANLRLANVVIINKEDSADKESIATLRGNIKRVNPAATIVDAASPIIADHPDWITNKRALVVEDGPTLTHGEMKFGAGTVAAKKYNAKDIIDPRPYTVGTITDTFKKYPDIGILLPAMGYGTKQIRDLETTINKVPCDVVVIGTPIDLSRLIKIEKPSVRIRYDLQEIGKPNLDTILSKFVRKSK
ncbi:GTPase, partial [bacterium]|nr:GTPase [bacterium]